MNFQTQARHFHKIMKLNSSNLIVIPRVILPPAQLLAPVAYVYMNNTQNIYFY